MTFPIDLLGELVAVKFVEETGTIRLPDWKRTLQGTLIAKGPEAQNVSVGDRVVFGAAVGMDSVLSGQTVRILKEADLDFVYDSCTCTPAIDPETNIEYHGKGCSFSEA